MSTPDAGLNAGATDESARLEEEVGASLGFSNTSMSGAETGQEE